MVRVFILVNATGAIDPSSPMAHADLQLISGLKQSILANASSTGVEVQVVAVDELSQSMVDGDGDPTVNPLVLPLTLDPPEWLRFAGRSVFQTCREVEGLRQRVAGWGYTVGDGEMWLPIVLTAKGPLFAEVIGRSTNLSPGEAPYYQPVHLPDLWRQSLYKLGQQLVQSLQATPSVYLLQFAIRQEQLWFDRLLPFPATPCMASLGVQSPDLLLCHWLCVTGQPIRDLILR